VQTETSTGGGVQLWRPSGAAIWSSPTVDLAKKILYVTTGNNYSDPPTETSDAFLAFDMVTGKLAWSRQINGAHSFMCSGGRRNAAAICGGVLISTLAQAG
jgi:polyvinyl alcohol dehydrogenase (cytochrome)